MRYTPVIVGSSGWLANAATSYFRQERDRWDPPIILGSKSRKNVLRLERGAPLEDVLLKAGLRSNLVCFHFAYLTQEKAFELGQLVYIQENKQINETVVWMLGQFNFTGLVYASSGAASTVHGKLEPQDLGKVLYGKLKAEDEQMFDRVCREHNITYFAPRIFNIGGHYINKVRSYAISDILYQLWQKNDVVINSKNRVFRSYCDVIELINVFAQGMERGLHLDVPNFEVGGAEKLEISDLARVIAEQLGIEGFTIIRPELDPNIADDIYLANTGEFNVLLNKLDLRMSSIDKIVMNTFDFMKKNGHLI